MDIDDGIGIINIVCDLKMIRKICIYKFIFKTYLKGWNVVSADNSEISVVVRAFPF